ncbi:MAG: endonuclease III domain-containing protein [Sedimentisphaerales bacterium]|nr:endonuclease III domain-containing protein [Sedimentisphaerales bacterium]
MQDRLQQFYRALLRHYGPQHWWPGESPFEVMVGAVLTQNTNWTNVEKAIARLKAAGVLDLQRLRRLEPAVLAEYIRPAGYYNLKARRLRHLVDWFCERYDGSLAALRRLSVGRLRAELLAIHGIGPETADSIILYALAKPTFVVDTYTHRILVRHHCLDADCDYEQIKSYCEGRLEEDVPLYNEFHALLVQVGKNHCRPRPRCAGCPLESFDHTVEDPND